MKRLSIGQRVVMLLAALLLVILIINIPDNNGQPSNNDSLILSKESKSVDSEQSADGFSGTETVRILSTGEMQKSMEKKSSRSIRYGEICKYDYPAAYDEGADAFYIPVNIETDVNNIKALLSDIKTDGSDKELYFAEDSMFADPAKAIEEGHLFQAMLVENNTYALFKVVFIGMPTIQLIYDEKQKSEENRVEYSGTIIVTDPLRKSVQESHCQFHVRGNVSQNYPKKNYRISLKDGEDNKINKELLGMRSDDDWILNALYSDKTRLRDYVSYQIWKKVNTLCRIPVASSDIAYCALFMNGESRGLYGLMIPIDRKLMGMKEGDILYKIEFAGMPDDNDYKKAEKSDRLITSSKDKVFAEIKYPNNAAEGTWDILHDYQNWAFNSQGDSVPAKISDMEAKGYRIDLQNFLTYSLYCIMLHAEDNYWRNTYLAAYKQFDGSWFLLRTVWDLNYTFGDEFVWDVDILCTKNVPESSSSMAVEKDYPLDFESYRLGNEEADTELASLWKKWRSNGVNSEAACEMIDKMSRELSASGAYCFENKCWSLEEPSAHLENAKEWTKRRFDFLDDFYGYDEREQGEQGDGSLFHFWFSR